MIAENERRNLEGKLLGLFAEKAGVLIPLD